MTKTPSSPQYDAEYSFAWWIEAQYVILAVAALAAAGLASAGLIAPTYVLVFAISVVVVDLWIRWRSDTDLVTACLHRIFDDHEPTSTGPRPYDARALSPLATSRSPRQPKVIRRTRVLAALNGALVAATGLLLGLHAAAAGEAPGSMLLSIAYGTLLGGTAMRFGLTAHALRTLHRYRAAIRA